MNSWLRPVCSRCSKREARNGGMCWECLDAVIRAVKGPRKEWTNHRDGRMPEEDDPSYETAARAMEEREGPQQGAAHV